MSSCTTIDYLRSFRVFDMAIFDWVGAFLGVYVINYMFPDLEVWNQPLSTIIVGTILIGVIVHYILDIPTMFNYYLGLSEKPEIKEC